MVTGMLDYFAAHKVGQGMGKIWVKWVKWVKETERDGGNKDAAPAREISAHERAAAELVD
jgi:hypothetical protein